VADQRTALLARHGVRLGALPVDRACRSSCPVGDRELLWHARAGQPRRWLVSHDPGSARVFD
jgi:hypothetical protein